jgi:drug/metabolite transporter (DMT)-like permease
MSTPRDRLRANLLLLAVVLVWGATFVIVKGALADASPTLFNLIRMALACGFLLAVYRPRFQDVERRQWIGGVAVGALLAAGYQFQTIGLEFTTASKSAFITGALVVMVPLFSGVLWLANRWAGSSFRDDDFFPGPRAFLGAALA